MQRQHVIIFFVALITGGTLAGQENAKGDPKATEVWSPEPKVVTPGKINTEPPSDAIILFNGKNLDEWMSVKDTTKPAMWTLADEIITVKK